MNTFTRFTAASAWSPCSPRPPPSPRWRPRHSGTHVKGYTKTLKSGKKVTVKGYTRMAKPMPGTAVKGYTKTMKSGKTVTVKGYTRKAPMKGMMKGGSMMKKPMAPKSTM